MVDLLWGWLLIACWVDCCDIWSLVEVDCWDIWSLLRLIVVMVDLLLRLIVVLVDLLWGECCEVECCGGWSLLMLVVGWLLSFEVDRCDGWSFFWVRCDSGYCWSWSLHIWFFVEVGLWLFDLVEVIVVMVDILWGRSLWSWLLSRLHRCAGWFLSWVCCSIVRFCVLQVIRQLTIDNAFVRGYSSCPELALVAGFLNLHCAIHDIGVCWVGFVKSAANIASLMPPRNDFVDLDRLRAVRLRFVFPSLAEYLVMAFIIKLFELVRSWCSWASQLVYIEICDLAGAFFLLSDS